MTKSTETFRRDADSITAHYVDEETVRITNSLGHDFFVDTDDWLTRRAALIASGEWK
jgi:hypothetical protein